MSQDGTAKIVKNALRAKDEAQRWQQIALVLSEALSSLDFSDIADVLPYSSAQEIYNAVKNKDLDQLCSLLTIG